ncbi:MAG: hypothetical protein RQ753_08040 [Desulfurivibrionaceae bacterium]|nr:hypothetical protein [Desulfobulbales bacterium]MDT8335634.1 hypothetical protein [Desulfurivibrionaceae bacterium]
MNKSLLFPALLFLGLLAGCATAPYHFGTDREIAEFGPIRPAETQIDRGRPSPLVDGAGHYVVSLPSKLILFNWEVDNHRISPETEAVLSDYLAANGLSGVKVRLNQYAPGGEWRRLFKNREMPGFFKYTVGIVSTSLYTALPGRFFGGDNYNPYTNTINLYSDHRGIALHEAAHAKDFAARPRAFRGWYAFMRVLPLMPLWQEARATGDAVGYTIEEEMAATEKDSYKVLYPAYATYIAGEGLRWVSLDLWVSYAAQLAVAIPGHIAGRIKAARVAEDGGEGGKPRGVPDRRHADQWRMNRSFR